MFAMTTKTSFLGIGKYLFITLIVVVVAALLNLFFMNSLLSIVISGVSAILFSFFIIYDTQRIYSGEFISPVDAALSMYLNILNLFIALLNILRTFSGRD
jgi:modulator of FtsH protease